MARPRQFTDAEILHEARRCFLEHGAHVSTAHIAQEIGLSQAALFKRFGTKENLLVSALAPEEIPEWIAHLDDGPSDAPMEEQLYRIAVKAFTFMKGLTPALMVLKSAGLSPQLLLKRFEIPPPLRARMKLTHFFEQALERGLIDTPDPQDLALQFMGAIHVRVFFGHMFGMQTDPAGDDAYLRNLVQPLCHGMLPGDR